MLALLTTRYSKYLLLVAMLLVLYVAYIFSFKHAIDAVRLNEQLSVEKEGGQSLDVSFSQIEAQHHFYSSALKAYKVKKEDREDRLWQALSGIALSKNVAISFVPNATLLVDTTVQQKGLVMQQYTLRGKYFDLIKALDSIGKTPDIGRIADLKLYHTKNSEDTAHPTWLTLQFTMTALAIKN